MSFKLPKRLPTVLTVFLSALVLVLTIIYLYSFQLVKSSQKEKPLGISSEVERFYAACGRYSRKEQCYADGFYTLSQKTDLTFAKKVLVALQKKDPRGARGCHLISHKIAYAQMEKDPSKWKDLLSQQDPNFCTGGFMHGILEKHMQVDQKFALTADQFPVICSIVKEQGVLSCNHILGHLLLVETGGDIDYALSVCKNVVDNAARYECMSGVFMENLTRLNLIDHKLAKPLPWNVENTKKIEALCLQHSGEQAEACWKEISYMYISMSNEDPAGLYEKCYGLSQKNFREACYIYGAGNMVVFSDFKASDLPRVCEPFIEKDWGMYDKCLGQITGSMMASSPEFRDNVISVCASAARGSNSYCFRQIAYRLKRANLPDKQKRDYCQNAPVDYKEDCING
ncbi:MAG: hypothetical protein HY431_01260 [Candidatus Levybacteria bacterium]|nr:hypothetical protein [Candidatus Levybacteria bacterium]